MRRTRLALLLAVFSLTACGSRDGATPSDLALPVTAPMKVRDRLLLDLNKEKAAARKRERQFDGLLEQNR